MSCPVSIVRLYLYVCVSLALPTTVSGLAKVAIFTTKFHTKNRTSNIRKTVIRSTEPPLLPNPCYAFVVLFGLGLFVCGYCCLGALAWWALLLFLALACTVGKKQMCHQKRWHIFKLNVFREWVGKSLFTFKL